MKVFHRQCTTYAGDKRTLFMAISIITRCLRDFEMSNELIMFIKEKEKKTEKVYAWRPTYQTGVPIAYAPPHAPPTSECASDKIGLECWRAMFLIIEELRLASETLPRA